MVAPRDVVAAGLPDPATIGPRMTGKTCAGVWVTGTGTDGKPREVYLYHVSDNEWTMAEYESQCVVWQTALNPVIALELLATGAWSGTGVLGPEAFDAEAFLDLMARAESDGGYGQQWGWRRGSPSDDRGATPVATNWWALPSGSSNATDWSSSASARSPARRGSSRHRCTSSS